jgi:hypothetical protein
VGHHLSAAENYLHVEPEPVCEFIQGLAF